MKRLSAALATLLLAFLSAGTAVANDTVYYYSSDTVRSEVVITDANRNVVEQTNYAPYGQVLNRALRDGPGYTGHEEDPESSLSYMQQRYYDPQSGRFLSGDPVATKDDGGSFNRYTYALDNPYRYTDPTGEDAGSCVYMGDCQTFVDVNNAPKNLRITGEIVGVVALTFATDGVGDLPEGGALFAKIAQVANRIRKLIGIAEDVKAAQKPEVSPPSQPDFIVDSSGQAFPVPQGAEGPTPVINPAGKQTGMAYTGGNGGANGQVSTLRNMDPTPPRGRSPGYPGGYVKYENAGNQGVDPYTGRTLPNTQSHFPKNCLPSCQP